MSSSSLRQLIHVGLEQQGLRGLSALAGVVAQAAGTSGVVLWEEAKLNGSSTPAVLAAWIQGGTFGHVGFTPEPDEVTRTALRSRTLALPANPVTSLMTGRDSRNPVVAAFPVDWLDGNRGVVTFLGDGHLTDEAFDIAADLIEVLPDMCKTLRERHTLALVNACNAILSEADVASPDEPLEPDELRSYLSRICETIAEGLQLVNVSLFLQAPDDPQDFYPLFASSEPTHDGAGIRRGEGLTATFIEHRTSKALPTTGNAHSADSTDQEIPAVMVVSLASGNRTWGAIVCRGTCGPPFRFTDSDQSLLTPIAAQISQYWSNWLHRCEILSENRSWRSLATGITGLNKQIHDQLSGSRTQDQSVYQAAFQVIHDVLPDCDGTDVRIPGNRDARGLAVASGYGVFRPPTSADTIVASAYEHGEQRIDYSAEPDAGAPGESAAAGWLVSTPIRVSGTMHGVLNAVGEHGALPPNSPEVCKIVGDQLGLYHYLRRTLTDLRKTKQKLEHTLRSQAEALEDLEHQLVSPLLGATFRTERVLQSARFDNRTEAQLRAIRGLCRKASRVAQSAGVFSVLSRGEFPRARSDYLGIDDLLRLVIGNADDAQLLINPRRHIRIDVDRESLRALNRKLLLADRTFLEQCVGNLLDNATKYSYEQNTVSVGGEIADDSFAIRVSSVGIPMKPEDVENCKKRNWRGKAARVATGEGSGLGLWIVDSLMHSMEGQLDIDADGDITNVSLRFHMYELKLINS
jgi:signal transduction histidine kinase